ncbi:MAG: phosphoribosylformylglycinamidine synthase subunit PurL [Spirochaetales bacterium]|nr:phosphoribosylformylglycinamidine synthase subunit PurL [Spirochaetales bacterium]MCF7938614.1 phosphoribosylformylglycinamidine synthase subunit PurL [Spirochaetales bacterium]
MRIELTYKKPELDGRISRTRRELSAAGMNAPASLQIVDVYLIEGIDLDPPVYRRIFQDPVVQDFFFDLPACGAGENEKWNWAVEVSWKPGVTDQTALTAREAVAAEMPGKMLPETAVLQTARQYLIYDDSTEKMEIEAFARALFNPLIQRAEIISVHDWDKGKRFPRIYPHTLAESPKEIERIDVASMDIEELDELSRSRLLALSSDEMRAIRAYYQNTETRNERSKTGIGRQATDVELEMLAQTWSEHCKHKIFQAYIDYQEGDHRQTIDSLFRTYISATTDAVSEQAPYIRSVFHDNSGVIDFDSDHLICFKAETHNSPSALDPYGGAITGIVGVNRDILGTGKGAKPIFNTNVLCFGPPDLPREEMPEGLMHPRRIMEGVHRGIIDGGNQSGIPVVAGGFLFDESYLGKPLVFCGTGGIMPASIGGESSWIKHIDPGDMAIMLGGRIGKDGIHGATFSSLALDEASPVSAVQIGDPITQKKMIDFLLEARDRGLYKGITDNGAGGLSSSLGEMAEEAGGIRIYLDRCPLKYPGLAPWEILVSESQERMSLSVAPEKLESFLELARRRDVEATVVGEFTDSEQVEVFYSDQLVGALSLQFLHHGLPRMQLKARWKPPKRNHESVPQGSPADYRRWTLDLLSQPNIASKERLVRQYDHEVQGQSVTGPFAGKKSTGPSDGAVIRPLSGSRRGAVISHGIAPRYGDIDTYAMAACSVDEALRAIVAGGGDPDQVSALDNFCWPDPVESPDNPDGSYKLAQLVRAARGLFDSCVDYGIPLISGKDSMKNDAVTGNKKISVRPTLLISMIGIIEDVCKSVSTDFKQEGDIIYLIGETGEDLGGSSLEALHQSCYAQVPVPRPNQAMETYRSLHAAMQKGLISSAHDLADGGLAVALAESCIGGENGCKIDIEHVPGNGGRTTEKKLSTSAVLFSETPSRLLVSLPPNQEEEFIEVLGNQATRLGTVESGQTLQVDRDGTEVMSLCLEEARQSFDKPRGDVW